MKNENERDPRWKPPVQLPYVTPEDYAGDEGAGSSIPAGKKEKEPHAGPPDYTMPGYPSSKDTAKPDINS